MTEALNDPGANPGTGPAVGEADDRLAAEELAEWPGKKDRAQA